MSSVLPFVPLVALPLIWSAWPSAQAALPAAADDELPPACSTCDATSPDPQHPFGPHTGLGSWLNLTINISKSNGNCDWQAVPQSQPPQEECKKLRDPCKFWGSIQLTITSPEGGSVGNFVPDPNGASTPKWINNAQLQWTVTLGTQNNKYDRTCGTDLPISFEATPTGTSQALVIDLKVACTACSGTVRQID